MIDFKTLFFPMFVNKDSSYTVIRLRCEENAQDKSTKKLVTGTTADRSLHYITILFVLALS